jgi:ATP-dependent protease Clp ATPase subunit
MDNIETSKKVVSERVKKIMVELDASLKRTREIKQRLDKEERANETKRKILGGVVFNHVFKLSTKNAQSLMEYSAGVLNDADFEFMFGITKSEMPPPPPKPPIPATPPANRQE